MQQTFRDLIRANKRNSALLVIGFCLFISIVIMVLSLAAVAFVAPDVVHALDFPRALLFGGAACGISLLISFLAYYQGDDFILGVSGAQQIQHVDDPELFNVVEEMAIAAGQPMPRVFLIHDAAPNAFATGRDPKHASVAVTTGLRNKLNREELQGVIAHEMAHIRNYDIRLMLLLAVLVGTVVMLTDVFWQFFRFGPSRSRSSSRGSKDDKGAGAIVLVLLVVAIVLAIIAPILAQLIQLAVSRQREYLADATAVELTRNPTGLANALRIIDEDPTPLHSANRGTAHLYIANPIKKFEARANSMFASHPPIQDRIRRLEMLMK